MPACLAGSADTLRTVGVKLDMDDAVTILPIDVVPIQQYLSSQPTNSIKVEWLNEVLTPQATAVVTDGTTSGAGTITVTATEGVNFRAGDILWDQNRGTGVLCLVTSIAGDVLTVAQVGSNTTAFTATDVLVIVGQQLPEGGDPASMRSIDRTTDYNYTQIGQEKVSATRTRRKQALYGMTDNYTHEVTKKFKELAIRYERQLLFGQRVQSGNQRTMGGLFYYLTSNGTSDTVANTKAALNSILRSTWNNGGNPKTLFVSPNIKTAIDANVDASLRRSTRTDTGGGSVVDTFMSSFGDIDIKVDRYLPQTKAILVQSEYVKRRVFDGYMHEALAKTGDSDNGEIVSEFSLEVRCPLAMGVLTLTDA